MTKKCVQYCRIGNKEFLPGTDYTVEYNSVDCKLRIWDVWGAAFVTAEFLNKYFI